MGHDALGKKCKPATAMWPIRKTRGKKIFMGSSAVGADGTHTVASEFCCISISFCKSAKLFKQSFRYTFLSAQTFQREFRDSEIDTKHTCETIRML